MTRGYLLDTNVVSELVRPEPDARVLAAVEKHSGAMCIGSPVWR